MIISPRYRFNSYSKNLAKDRNERDTIRATNKKVKNSSNDKKNIYFKTKIRDNNIYNHLYNTINLSDRGIVEKKISLSNVYNINNTINIGNHPINMSLRPVSFNNSYYVENSNLNLYDIRKIINNRKVLKKIILIQSFVRRFLLHKKYYNKLLNSKNGLQRSKIVLYKKKLPISNKNTAYYLPKKLINYKEENIIIKKHNINNNFFFTKTIVNNGYYDKKKVSLIQKYWRKRKNELIISNYSRLSNFQTQSEIASKFYNNSQRINLMKRTHNDSILMNSLSSFKENEEEENNNIDKSKFTKSIKLTWSTNKGIFNKFYSINNNKRRPRYIQINNKNNQTVIIGRGNEDENDEEVYQYEANEDESFKGRSFTLLRDKNQNGNYIQQVKANTGKKVNPKAKRIDIGMTYKKSRKQYFLNSQEIAKLSKNKEYEKINNKLKMWQKNEIFFKCYKGNILQYKDLKPNKNFISIISYKKEKPIILGRKKNIISKPKISSMKKISNSGKNNLLKKNPMKLISKYFINDKTKESNLVLERNLIMKKPFQYKKLNIKI